MPLSNYEKLKLYFLQEYHRHGLPARIALVHLFLDQLEDNLKKFNVLEPTRDFKFNLNNKQKISLLQIAAISHIMFLIEDVAAIFTAFRDKDWDYYKYLDRKEEEDLGIIIGKFYEEIPTMKDNEIIKILGYLDPKNMEVSESERDFLRGMIKKNTKTMRYFLFNSGVFWRSHIKIFRRYKHAGFPAILGMEIPREDESMKNKFDFVSFALTSKEKLDKEIIMIPFSKKAVKSYQTLLYDISQMLYFCIQNNLMKIEREMEGVVPNPNDFLSPRLTNNERKKLSKIYKKFVEETEPEKNTLQAKVDYAAESTPWYIDLDIYSKSAIDIALEKESKQ